MTERSRLDRAIELAAGMLANPANAHMDSDGISDQAWQVLEDLELEESQRSEEAVEASQEKIRKLLKNVRED